MHPQTERHTHSHTEHLGMHTFILQCFRQQTLDNLRTNSVRIYDSSWIFNYFRQKGKKCEKWSSEHFKIAMSAKMNAIVEIIMYVLNCNPFLSCNDNIDEGYTTTRRITSIYLLG